LTKRLAGLAFAAASLAVLVLHACSLGFAPWMDEAHIVEMGRLTFGTATESILATADGSFFTPLYYLGPCLHEWAFRLAGPFGTRLLPMLALILAAALFRIWLRLRWRASEMSSLLLALVVLTMPLFVQSTRLVRVDMAVMALTFGVLLLLDVPHAAGNRVRIGLAAALSAISPFLWPSAVLLLPLFAASLLIRAREERRPLRSFAGDLLLFAAVFLVTALLALLPIREKIVAMLNAFGTYFGSIGANTAVSQGTGFSVVGLLRGLTVQAVKETLRAPFFAVLLPVGLLLAIRAHKVLLTAFFLGFLAALATGLHTFRNIYLFPYLILFFCLACRRLEERFPRLTRGFLAAAIAYGLVTGPLAYAMTDSLNTARQSARTAAWEKTIGPGSHKVLTLDYSAYYAARQRGWRLMAYPMPAQTENDPCRLLDDSSFVIVPETDRYRAIEESYTFYGLMRNLALRQARIERENTEKSPLARIGEAFAYDELPDAAKSTIVSNLVLKGFSPAVHGSEVWAKQ